MTYLVSISFAILNIYGIEMFAISSIHYIERRLYSDHLNTVNI